MAAKTRPNRAKKTRLDLLLLERGLFESRSKAAASVMAGDVLVGAGRRAASKPGELVEGDAELTVREAPRYVSRGGIKLERALDSFAFDVSGRLCLDVGASTGGFSDCLLQAGAAQVVALDVGYGELHWRLRSDSRLTALERQNARELVVGMLPYAPDLIVVDVSFIGLGKVLPAIVGCAAERFDLLALVKPQFELGKERVGRGGVVRDAHDRREALTTVAGQAQEVGLSVRAFCSSGLPGPAGNRESFVWCSDRTCTGVADVATAVLAAEPQERVQ